MSDNNPNPVAVWEPADSPRPPAGLGAAGPAIVAPSAPATAAGGGPVPPVPPVVAYPSFGPQWPGPGRTAPAGVFAAALVTAVAAAAGLGWDRPGIGWFATGLVGAIAVVAVVVTPTLAGAPTPAVAPTPDETQAAPQTQAARAMRAVWAVLALALLLAGGLRAATWLWALCLPTALICGALALAGGRSLRALFMALVAVPIAMFRALPWASRGLAGVRGRTTSSAVRVVAAAVVALVLVLIFGALFAGADKVFASVVDKILPTVDANAVGRWIWNFLLLFLGTLAACFLALRPPAFDPEAGPAERRTLSRLEWGLPIGALVLLFGAFVAVQATVLFGGREHVLRTAGLTYAEYARQGFWQLLTVTVLTLFLIAAAVRLAGRQSVEDRIWLRSLLGLLAVLTLVIVASALSRMFAYEQAYGYSRLRLLVSVCEGWLGLVFVLVLAAGVRLRAPWLPRTIAATAAVALLGIVAVNPDLLIARQNVARYEETGKIDIGYLRDLSADAVPALDRLPSDLRECAVELIAQDLEDMGPDELYEWNLGRTVARRALDGYEPPRFSSEAKCYGMYTGP
jgi:hypothetical protein